MRKQWTIQVERTEWEHQRWTIQVEHTEWVRKRWTIQVERTEWVRKPWMIKVERTEWVRKRWPIKVERARVYYRPLLLLLPLLHRSPATLPPPSTGIPPMARPRSSALTNDTRRFWARPSGVALSATGLFSPNPTAIRRLQSIPLATSQRHTAKARFSVSVWLY